MQWRAAIWILVAFQTSPFLSIKAIASLIPIYLHLQKISGRFQLRMQLLSPNHIIKSFLDTRHSNNDNNYCLLLKKLTSKQQLNIKGSIVDINSRLNRIFLLFDSFSSEFSPRNRLINTFPSYFSFYSMNRKSKKSSKIHIYKLNEIILQVLADSRIAVVISDISIKNQVATLIAHIHINDHPIIKTLLCD